MPKTTPKVSIVMPIYKPEKEVFQKVKEMLQKQTISAEIVESWNMPEAKSMNNGIKKAKGEIIVILSADCVPENEFWLEKLISPLRNKEVIATVSDLFLPEYFWKKYPFLIRLFTLNERNVQYPTMDMRACAYRKKDLIDVGLINEDPKVIGIDTDLYMKIKDKGKIVHPDVVVFHLHKQRNLRTIAKKIFIYSEANGKVVRKYKDKIRNIWFRIARAFPFFGIVIIVHRFPFKKYFYLLPLSLIFSVLPTHILNVLGFWKGFFFNKESIRNKEVLAEKKNKL